MSLRHIASPPLLSDDVEQGEKITRVGPRQSARRVRSPAITGIFLLALVSGLYFAKVILLPITLAVLLSFIFVPVVRGLKRLRIPEGVAAGLIVIGVVATFICGFYLLAQPAADWVQRAPQALDRIEAKIRVLKKPVERVNQATEQVEKLANGESKGAARVELKGPGIGGTLFVLTRDFIAQTLILLVLLYFLLASGDLFLRKLIHVLPRFEDKKVAVDIARQIEHDISIYLLTVTMINSCLGAVVAGVLFAFGMPNPMLWGAMAGLLNFIPYIGPSISMTVIAVVAMLTFDRMSYALLPPAAFLALATVEGNFITPYILGRRLTLNPVAIIIGLVFWGWVWGIFGALIAVPILAITKILCERLEPLAPLGEFLGR